MFRLITILLIVLMVFGISGARPLQDKITLFQGEEQILPTSGEIPRIFGHDETGYYALGNDYRYYLEHFDKNLNSKQKNHLILHRRFRHRDLEAVFYFHGKIYLFTSDQRFSKKILYVQTVDKKNLRQFDDERKVMTIDHFKGWIPEFNFMLSRKEDRLLVFSRLDAYSKNIQDLYFHLYGEDLTLEWESRERIVYKRRAPRESKVKISDEGNVFIISLLDDQNILSHLEETKNRYFLLAITDNGKTVHQYPVDFPNLYIRGLQIEPGKNHDLSCTGFYSPTHFRGMIDGMFYFEVNNRKNQIENLRLFEFEKYFLNEAMGLKEGKEPEEMFSFRISHLILRDNADMIMIAENQLKQDYENFMNIMVASFSPGGQLNWKRVIPKSQSYHPVEELNFSSYAVHAPWYNNQVSLVFNDHLRNVDNEPGEKIRTFSEAGKAVLKSVGIGPSGEISSLVLYEKTRLRMKTPLPLASYSPPGDEMIVPALRFRNLSFFRIRF